MTMITPENERLPLEYVSISITINLVGQLSPTVDENDDTFVRHDGRSRDQPPKPWSDPVNA